jgi:hypothetical protein
MQLSFLMGPVEPPVAIPCGAPGPPSMSMLARLGPSPPERGSHTSTMHPLPPLPPGIEHDAQGRPALHPAQASFVGMPPGFSPSMRSGEPASRPMGGSGLYRTAGGKHMIMVPTDEYQASKSADEKQVRNARASARFRFRKKEKEQEREKKIRELQDEIHDLRRERRELAKQAQRVRDFYCGELGRLRDIVARTPQISELANAGGPSPPLIDPGFWGVEATQACYGIPALPGESEIGLDAEMASQSDDA